MHVILQPKRVEPTVKELTTLLHVYYTYSKFRNPEKEPNFAKDFPNLTYIFACMIADNHLLEYQGGKLMQLYEKTGFRVDRGQTSL